MLAIFDNLGFSELMIVVVFAVLIFGKRLPEVAAQAGAQIGKFRRSLQDIKNETGIDEDLRKIQRDIQNAVPRDLSMGEMARIASAELEKRMMANDERKEPAASSEATKAAATGSAAVPMSVAPDGSVARVPVASDGSLARVPVASDGPAARVPVASDPSHKSSSAPDVSSAPDARSSSSRSDAAHMSAPSIAAAHETGARIERKD